MIENYLEVGINKTKNKVSKTLILAILAGFFIAIAGAASTIVSYTIKVPSISKLLSGIIFPIGLILVILLQTELFTGNSLLIIPLLKKKINIKDLLKNWLIVYLGNLVGAIILCILLYFGGFLNNTLLAEAINKTFSYKISLSFINSISLGILCNILVCIAVYLACSTKNIIEKIFVIVPPILVFIVLGFEHSVANMYYLTIGLINNFNFTNLGSAFLNNLLPVTIGNIIGGSLFGYITYYINNKK